MVLDYREYEALARRVISEGCVLLKNYNALPLAASCRVALYGRMQSKEYIAGIGSGGLDCRFDSHLGLCEVWQTRLSRTGSVA